MNPNPQLSSFLSPYKKSTQRLLFELRDFITETVPEANELIWDNYNAVAIAYSKSMSLKDAFCHLAVYTDYVNFGFNRGVELRPVTINLKGNGKLIRHFSVLEFEDFPKAEVQKLIWEALLISEQRNEDLITKSSEGQSIVMSISEKKRRPKKDSI